MRHSAPMITRRCSTALAALALPPVGLLGARGNDGGSDNGVNVPVPQIGDDGTVELGPEPW